METGASSVFEKILGSFIVLIASLISVFSMIFSERSAGVYEVGLSRVYISKLYNGTVGIKFFLILLSSISEENPNTAFMICIGTLYGVCSGVDLLKNFPFSDLKKVQASAVGVSLIFIGIIALLVDQSAEKTFTLVAVITPVCVCLCLVFTKKLFYARIFYGIVKNSLLKEDDILELNSPFFVH